MEDLIERYKADKMSVINEKKSVFKKADASFGYVIGKLDKSFAKKGVTTQDTSVNKTIVGNTYLWYDSHGDVHDKGCFANSIKNDMMPVHLHDHEFKILSQVGLVKSVSERKMSWKKLGVSKDGYTEVLLLESEVKKEYNSKFYEMYKDGLIQQHSVGMRYVDVQLAVNSDEKWAKEAKALWDEMYDKVANKKEIGNHFWVVKEAKLIEVSAVIRGSNILTPTIKIEDEQHPTLSADEMRKVLKFLD
jgi:hypothetical protein